MTSLDLGALALSVATGIAAGLVGCFALMRRMTLASDALSHVALPGIGLAILLHVHPLAGGVVALLLGAKDEDCDRDGHRRRIFDCPRRRRHAGVRR